MKKITSLLIFCFISVFVNAQNCNNPITPQKYRHMLTQLALQPNDPAKFQYSKTMLQGNCLLSAQIKETALVFEGDYYRLEFCKRAWHHTFDVDNFYEVYDSFSHLSAALRLYDIIQNKGNSNSPVPDPEPVPPPVPVSWFPPLTYPTAAGYKGLTGCQLPLADNDFEILSKPVRTQNTDAAIRTEAIKFCRSNCVSMGQTMKLATLFSLESNRLSFMKEVFPVVYDLENYGFGIEIFSHLPYKEEWKQYSTTYLQSLTPEPAPPVVQCEVTPGEFTEIKRSIENVSVNSTKETLARQIISSKKCFSVSQLSQIMKLFSIESSRLEIALFSYEYCINTQDYYQLTESLITTSSKNKLLEFLNSKN